MGKRMTMPHLMNCPHSDEGWCLACVGRLQEIIDRMPLAYHHQCSLSQGECEEIAQDVIDAVNAIPSTTKEPEPRG